MPIINYIESSLRYGGCYAKKVYCRIDKVMEHGNRGCYRAKKFDGVAEAHLIATACSSPPEGRNRWTVRLLADEMVSLGIVDSCGKSTVHSTLKKTNLSLT